MRNDTDLKQVKTVARSLMMTDIHETNFSSVIVKHMLSFSADKGEIHKIFQFH